MKKGISIIFLCIFLSSCTKNTTTSDTRILHSFDKHTTTQLNVIGQWLNEGKRENLVREFVREYEFKNQHTSINLKFPEEVYYDRSDNYSDPKFIYKNITQSTSGWDIIRVNGDYSGVTAYCNDPDWPSKYLVDFSKIPGFMRNVSPQINIQKVKDKWNGIIPGPIIEGQYWALWVNTKLAREIGIEIKQYGMTYDDFLSYVKSANAYNQSNNNKITILHDASDWSTLSALVLQLFGSAYNSGDIFSAPSYNKQKHEDWYKTLKALEELSKYNILSLESKTISWSESRFDLLNERCLFYSNGSWMYNIWDAENPEVVKNCMPCEYPTFNPVDFYPGAYEVMWAVPKNAPNKEEAIDFLTAMNNPTMADLWVRNTKCPTGIKGNVVGVSFGNDLFENFSSHIQSAYGSNLFYSRESGSTLFGADFEDFIINQKQVLLGEITADEAIQQLNKYIEERQIQ